MRSRSGLALGGLLTALACAQIAGIEDAELDPELSEGGGSSSDAGAANQASGGRDATGGRVTSGGASPSGGAPPAGSAGAAETGGTAGAAETGGAAGMPETGGAAGAAETGGAGGTPDTGGSGGDGGAGPSPLCEEFCTTVQANCTETHQVYVSEATCLRVCSFLEPGDPADETGPSVHCRLNNARFVAMVGEPEVHCPAAGPGGDGICGENCENFCTIALASCIDPMLGGFQERDVCIADCPATDFGGFDVSQSTGDSMQCRLYHACAASVGPVTHCPHTQGDIGPCAPQ